LDPNGIPAGALAIYLKKQLGTHLSFLLIDISIDKSGSERAYVYLDGPDARLFKRLRERLGSDELAQKAIILEGLIKKLEDSQNTKRAEEVIDLFPRVAGLSHAELQKIASSV
jgi:hypothetical protein